MAADNLLAVSRLTDALSRAATLDDVYAAALDALQSSLGVGRASILLFDEQDFCGFVAWRGLSDSYRAAVNGHTPWRPDSHNPEPITVEDVTTDESLAAFHDRFAAENIRAVGFFPLNYRDRVLGKFMLYYEAPHRFTESEVALAKTIAGQIAFGVARVRAERDLANERQRLVDMLANIPGVVWETVGTSGLDNRVTFLSAGIEALTGYSAGEWLADPQFARKTLYSDPDDTQRRLVAAMHSRGPTTTLYQVRHRDGRGVWVEVRADYRKVDGKMIGRGFTADVTERLKDERRATFLAEASTVLASSLDYETTLASVARLAVAELADWVTIDLFSETGEIERIAVVHRDPALAEVCHRIRVEYPPSKHEIGLGRRVIETGAPSLVREVDAGMRARFHELPVAPLLEKLGFNSFIIVPLASGGRTFGAMSFVSSGERRYDEHDLSTAMELGRRAASAVDNARLFRDAQLARRAAEQQQRRTAFLSDVSAVLSTSLNYETMLRRVAQLVTEDFGDWCAVNIKEADDDDLRRVVLLHRDPSKDETVERFLTHRVRADQSRIVRDVVHSAQPQLFTHFDEREWDRYADDPEFRNILADLGIESLMVVPLLTGGRAFGAISIVSSDPGRHYDANDLAVAVELGRRAAAALDNARLFREARDANRAKDEFLATLSHELRTPMTATLGWASMLRMGDLSKENFELAVETIERSTKAQAKLIDEILDVSRIVTGKLELAVMPLNLAAIIEAAADAIRPSLAPKNLTLHLDLGRIDGMAMGDAARLQQVIWNLLSNSVKFTPPNGTIDVTLSQQNNAVRISVRDSGHGIPPKFLPHIFERFRQADSSSTRAHGGLGLGLAIVKSIVELHGGNVEAQSDGEGKGATFTITLPLVIATTAAAPQPTRRNDAVTLDGISILLLEDEDDTRRMLSAALESFGARVTAVSSVPAALAAVHAQPPHVIVSDIGIPGEDGYSFMAKLRTSPSPPPAIALTAYARAEDRDRILASGFAFHLAKPVDPVTMAQKVREAVR